MILEVFCVLDRAVGHFNNPFVLTSKGQAQRGFQDEVNNKESALHKHPDDYDLYTLGTFDTATAEFKTHSPVVVVRGIDLVLAPKAQ